MTHKLFDTQVVIILHIHSVVKQSKFNNICPENNKNAVICPFTAIHLKPDSLWNNIMITRKIGKILRGKATPFQIISACILGSLLAFTPGFMQAPGLILFYILLLIIINANLFIAAISCAIAKLAALLLMPISFVLGQFLLDGPTQVVFKSAVNAPVLAFFGLDYYVTPGGIVLGLFTGIILGYAVISILATFRKKMAQLETGSEKFKKVTSSIWVKILIFIFIGGGHGKKTYNEILGKKIGNPIRITGVIFAILIVAFVVIIQMFFAGPIVTMVLTSGLEKANGATVDLENAEIDLKGGRLTITNLAMADPNQLDTDLLRATTIEADINATDLLRKRLRIEKIVGVDVSQGKTRKIPGKLVGPAPEPSPPIDDTTKYPDAQDIEDYITNAKIWKERLAQVKEWLQTMSGPPVEEQVDTESQSYKDWLEEQVRLKGYANVRAPHLIADSPLLTIDEIIANGITTTSRPDQLFDLSANYLSTQPYLITETPRLIIKSQDETILVDITLGTPSAEQSANDSIVAFKYLGLPTDTFASQLKITNPPPIQGGTIDVNINGKWSGGVVGELDLPMQITLHNTTISIPQLGSSPVELLNLPVTIYGPIDNPRINIDDKALSQALMDAGAKELANRLQGEVDKAVDDVKEDITKKIGDEVGDKADDLIKGVFGNKKKNDK